MNRSYRENTIIEFNELMGRLNKVNASYAAIKKNNDLVLASFRSSLPDTRPTNRLLETHS